MNKKLITTAVLVYMISLSSCYSMSLFQPTTPTSTSTSIPTATHTKTPYPTATSTPSPTPMGGRSSVVFQETQYGDIFISNENGENRVNLTADLSGEKYIWYVDVSIIVFGQESDQIFDVWETKTNSYEKQIIRSGLLDGTEGLNWTSDCSGSTYCSKFTDPGDGEENRIISPSNGDSIWYENGSHSIMILREGLSEPISNSDIFSNSRVSLLWALDGQSIFVLNYGQSNTYLTRLGLDGNIITSTNFKNESVNFESTDFSPNVSFLLINNTVNSNSYLVAEKFGFIGVDCENLTWLPENVLVLGWSKDGKQIKYAEVENTTQNPVGYYYVDSSTMEKTGYFMLDPVTGTITPAGWLNWSLDYPSVYW